MRRPQLPLFVLSLALVTACGGGDGGGDDGTGPPPPTPPPAPQLLCPAGGELSLAVGEQLIVRNQSTYCFNLPAGSSVTEYLLGVQSVGEGGVAIRSITVRGERVTTTAALQASAQGAPPAPDDAGGALQLSPELLRDPGFQLLQDHRKAHRAMFARMLQPVRDPFVRQGIRSAAQRGPARAIVTGTEEIGDQVEFRVRRGNSRNCEEPASGIVLAELRVKNDKSMWFVDVENPAGGFTDGQLQELADVFDNHIYATEIADALDQFLSGDSIDAATAFGDNWFGRGAATTAWANTTLPAKP